jgi:hypothetical protein
MGQTLAKDGATRCLGMADFSLVGEMLAQLLQVFRAMGRRIMGGAD